MTAVSSAPLGKVKATAKALWDSSAQVKAPSPPPAVAILVPKSCGFDVAKTLSLKSGFKFSQSDTHVVCPSGPVNLLTDALVGPGLPCTVAFVSFVYCGGNNSWSVGVIPEAQAGNANYLYKSSPGTVGRNNMSGSNLPKLPMPQGKSSVNENETITMLVHAVQRKWYVLVSGQPLVVEDIPASQFPLRLAFCGHNCVNIQLIPGDIPAAIKSLL